MITFACEFCARKYRVDDGLAGRKVKCKECSTEMVIPSAAGMAASASPASPKPDLYGLDDEGEVAPPPPRRPGISPGPSASRGGKPSGSGSSDNPLRRFGVTMMVAGGLVFILPVVGLQIKGLHLLSPQAQMTGGMLLLVAGGFFLLLSVFRLGKFGVLKWVGGIVVVVFVLPIFVGLLMRLTGMRGNRAPVPRPAMIRIPPPNFVPPPNFPQRPDFNAPAARPPAARPPGNGPSRVTIHAGRARLNQRPGSLIIRGVAFEIDYSVENNDAGLYNLFIKSSKGSTQIVPPLHLNASGSLQTDAPNLSRDDGPFEAYFQTLEGGPDSEISNRVTLTWVDADANNPGDPTIFPPGSRFRVIPRGPRGRPPGIMVPDFGPRGPR